MNFFLEFITTNFTLLCISVIMLINCIQYFRRQPRISLFSIIVIGATLLLAVFETMENVGRYYLNIPLTTASSIICYILRPIVIFFFVVMVSDYRNKKIYFLISIPLIINVIVYSLAAIPQVGKHIVFYTIEEGAVSFKSGGILRYTSHFVGALYLLYLFAIFILNVRAKHLNHALAVIFCIIFVVLAVILETFFNNGGDVYILNSTIGVGAFTYFLYSYIEKSQIDALTHLFNRESYYRDVPRMGYSMTGVVQFDLNGLKYINDNYGHLEGDKALAIIAQIIISRLTKKMYAYRLGGDEYVVLAVESSEEEVVEFINQVKEDISKSSYHCSIGYSFRKDKSTKIVDMLKEAERNMYKDKEEFYKTAEFDRRQS